MDIFGRKLMNCEKCKNPIKKTLVDNCVSRLKLYKTVAYYCDYCDKIYILEKYREIIDESKYDGELEWLRKQNPYLKK